MAKAGIPTGEARPRNGQGRAVSRLSFHSLRHSFNSAMANHGVSQEVRMQLTGHATADMNKVYTQHEIKPLRAAIELLPTVKIPKP
jgi:integrase